MWVDTMVSAETEGEAIKYNIEAKDYQKEKKLNIFLAGPSCDGHDVLYKKIIIIYQKI